MVSIKETNLNIESCSFYYFKAAKYVFQSLFGRARGILDYTYL